MKLYLVRHTAVNLPSGTCYGISDIPLRDNWEDEAGVIASRLAHLNNAVVYSSPSKRCKLLAKKISNKVFLDKRLQELNFGKWELKPWDEINGPTAEQWMNDFVHTRCEGGESYLDLSKRVKSFLTDLTCTKRETAIIVSHAGVIRAIVASVFDIPLKKSFEIKVDYGQITPLYLLHNDTSGMLNFAGKI
ncbi:MAG TPA: alpha-ribazole phosphatase [Bacteroidales bacterium]